MPQIVYRSPWGSLTDLPVPSLAEPGDLILIFGVSVAGGIGAPPGFVSVGSVWGPTYLNVQTRESVQAQIRVWARSLGSDIPDTVSGPTVGNMRGQLVIVRGTTGVGRVRTGGGAVPVEDRGVGIVYGARGTSWGSLPTGGGLVWESPYTSDNWRGLGRPTVVWGSRGAPSGGGTVTADSPSNFVLAFELLPPGTPQTPTLLEPENSSQTGASSDTELRWLYRPTRSGGYQDAYRIRLDIVGVGVRWWNTNTQSLSASQVTNTGSDTRVEIPGGTFAAGDAVSWQVDTREGLDGEWSGLSGAFTFTPVTPPSVTVTGPSGTVMNDLSPEVTWTSTTPEGVQTAYRVEVLDSGGQVVYRSGAMPGTQLSQRVSGVDWDRGGTYIVQVMVQQTGGSWSNWSQGQFTVDWDTPAEPEIVAEPGGPVRSALTYAWTGDPDDSTSTRTTVEGTVTNLFENPRFVTLTGGGDVAGLSTSYNVPTLQPSQGGGNELTLTGTNDLGPGQEGVLPIGAVGLVALPGAGLVTVKARVRIPEGYDASEDSDVDDVDNEKMAARALRISKDGIFQDNEFVQAPSEPGEYELSVSANVTSTGVVVFTLGGSGKPGQEITWLPGVTVVEGEYYGPRFTGATESQATVLGPEGVTVTTSVNLTGIDAIEVERSTLTGGWERILEFAPSGNDSFQDVFARYGVDTVYRARSVSDLDGMRLTSDWVESAPVVNTDQYQYVASGVDPVRTWQKVKLVEDSEQVLQRPTAVAYGLGDTRPRVTYGQHRGRAGVLVLSTLTDPRETLTVLVQLLESSETLMMRWGAEGFHQQEEDAGVLVFSVAESLTEERGAQVNVLRGRQVSVPWVEQDPPTVGVSVAPSTHPVVVN